MSHVRIFAINNLIKHMAIRNTCATVPHMEYQPRSFSNRTLDTQLLTTKLQPELTQKYIINVYTRFLVKPGSDPSRGRPSAGVNVFNFALYATQTHRCPVSNQPITGTRCVHTPSSSGLTSIHVACKGTHFELPQSTATPNPPILICVPKTLDDRQPHISVVVVRRFFARATFVCCLVYRGSAECRVKRKQTPLYDDDVTQIKLMNEAPPCLSGCNAVVGRGCCCCKDPIANVRHTRQRTHRHYCKHMKDEGAIHTIDKNKKGNSRSWVRDSIVTAQFAGSPVFAPVAIVLQSISIDKLRWLKCLISSSFYY